MKQKESIQLIISWLTISFAFAVMMSDGLLGILRFPQALPVAIVAVGTGFIFHELAHRNVARHFGVHAEYRLWVEGLIFTLLIPIISAGNFFFAAPGAVYIYDDGKIGKNENGIISAAGPATNIVLGFFFLALIIALGPTGLFEMILIYSASINFYLAFFNLLPFFILDGAKVISWNAGIWGAMFLIAMYMSFFGM